MFIKLRDNIAYKVSNWILKIVLKLDDKDLIAYYAFIEIELKKRGIEDVRSCADFFG